MEPKQKQHPPSTADPPTRSSSSSSSSESESESESDEQQQPHPNRIVQDFTSSSSEEDDQQQQQQQPSRNPNSKPSESESESESDSDSDSEPKLATPAQKHKQPAPEPPKSGSKRPAENDAGPKPASKKPTPPPDNSDEAEDDGKKPGGGGGGGHLKLFRRVFSDEDEPAILKGMVEFISRTGQDPIKYPDSFHSSMKKSLQLEASVNQLKEKIRRLRKKFETNLLRAMDGEDPKFFKSHDHTVFELSKKVWGEASMMVVKPILNGKPPKSPNPKKKGVGGGTRNVAIKTCLADVDSLYREISGVKELNEDEMKRGLALIGESKRKELEGRWKKLRLAEIELVANRSLLTGEQIKWIHEALESSGK
ncbi:hypothetical protein Fmac_016355 [Flemingia macrophylla]|uniref:Glabrous enhancer-binding protein-like DBD domain-containing protein n=1 Tax=Flemingia macrophylla TaxID=520843 RepID=A0ABD1MH57_9FABA